jgi:hypothetical protein
VKLCTVFPPPVLVAVQVTVVVPNGNRLPGAGSQRIVGAGLSPDETSNLTTAPALEVASALRPAGTIKAGTATGGASGGLTTIGGGSGRLTTTGKVVLALCPRLSAAEQVTVVVPTANFDPEAGAHVTARGPSTRSAAVGSV